MNSYSLLFYLYSGLLIVLQPFFWLLSRFSKKLKNQFSFREVSEKWLQEMAGLRQAKKKAVIFFCSSAGEFEQAKPLIDRFLNIGEVFVVVFFFSHNGYSFAVARKETLPFHLSPVDTVWNWERIFLRIKPDLTVIVRHELWPGFIAVAQKFSKLILIDATKPASRKFAAAAAIFKALLLRNFTRIYPVTENDCQFFQSLGCPSEQLFIAGDTKYDRVRERVKLKAPDTEKLYDLLSPYLSGKKRLVIGSAWPADVKLVTAAVNLLKTSPDLFNFWQLILVPHEVDQVMVESIAEICRKENLPYLCYSDIEKGNIRHQGMHPPPDVILVDRMGKLAEIYELGHLAFVGGAVHHKVHNVLEPACRGLPLTFGPFYENSPEARFFVESKLATVINTPEELTDYLKNFEVTWKNVGPHLVKAVNNFCGASDRIVSDIFHN